MMLEQQAKRAARKTTTADGHFSHSLARGLQVIKAFGQDAPMLRITDVARRTGLSRAAARRFLLTLIDLQYVGCSDDLFYLRPRALEIGYSYLASIDADRIIQPFLNELTNVTRETSSFGVLDGADIRLIARSASNRMLNYSIHLGGRVPAYGTSLGRVLLANLPPPEFAEYCKGLPDRLPTMTRILAKAEVIQSIENAKSRGWAVIEEKDGQGMSSIAVPISDQTGAAIAAINVVEYPPKSSAQTMHRKFGPLLRDAAQQIQSALHAAKHLMTITPSQRPPFG